MQKRVIKDCGVETCSAVGILAPAHSILIRFRDGMPTKPHMGDGKSHAPWQNRQANEAVMLRFFFLLLQEADRALGEPPCLSAVVPAGLCGWTYS